ncbi:MAG: alpha/beta fold hydrolase [Actinobacteria bacterium]|nr:alpha/beta fold hydrolase [Actinomycetota bacterium]
MLLLLRGFATPATAYDVLVAPLRSAGVPVLVPEFYGLNGYLGRYTAADEAADAITLLAQTDSPVLVAGHSRGGQVAWRLAQSLATSGSAPAIDLRGLVLIDPVDGAGPRATSRLATANDAAFTIPTLIIGAGIGGRCAPSGANHTAFARATPSADHIVIEQMGHADILSGTALAIGRRLCGGAPNPAVPRAEVTGLLTSSYRSALGGASGTSS